MGERAASTRRVTLLPMRVSELGGGRTAGDHVRVADAQAFIVRIKVMELMPMIHK